MMWILCSFLFLLSGFTSGLYIEKAEAQEGILEVKEDGREPLRSVMNFYKSLPKTHSVEVESSEVINQKPISYRIELSKGDPTHEDDDATTVIIPFEPEGETETFPSTTIRSEIDKISIFKTKDIDAETKGLAEKIEKLNKKWYGMKKKNNMERKQAPRIDLIDTDLDDSSEEVAGKTCVEGDVTRVGCNTCVCAGGIFVCSRVICPNHENFNKPNINSMQQDDRYGEEVLKIKDDAQIYTKDDEGKQCKAGATRRHNCNQCICAMGNWACTKHACIAATLREKASYINSTMRDFLDLKENMYLDEDCAEGETRQYNCNQCVCNRNSWACTELQCPANFINPGTKVEKIVTKKPFMPALSEFEEACKTEEDVKARGCNACTCRSGVWVCTQNICDEAHQNYNY